MPSGLAYSTDVYHRNNRKDSNQATMNNKGMERGRMRKEPDNQSSGKATAKIDRKTAAAASTFLRGDEEPRVDRGGPILFAGIRRGVNKRRRARRQEEEVQREREKTRHSFLSSRYVERIVHARNRFSARGTERCLGSMEKT